ncbi:MAG: malto-oligosyltrehalose trehalohydrolase, partial [Paracoccaceae bacterium]|nr:malto-oligosyltrehalose trehalohydrolase [Paracoccaceae bacterium]
MRRAFRKSWGAELLETGARFRLWAPGEDRLSLRHGGQDHPMEAEGGGWFSLDVPGARAGDDYAFVLADGRAVPDP